MEELIQSFFDRKIEETRESIAKGGGLRAIEHIPELRKLRDELLAEIGKEK